MTFIAICSFCLIVGTYWFLHKHRHHGKIEIITEIISIPKTTSTTTTTTTTTTTVEPKIVLPKYSKMQQKQIQENKQCFQSQLNNVELFEDVTLSKYQPTLSKSIFFHVILCPNNGTLRFNARYVND